MRVQKKDEEVTHVIEVRLMEVEVTDLRKLINSISMPQIKKLVQQIVAQCEEPTE